VGTLLGYMAYNKKNIPKLPFILSFGVLGALFLFWMTFGLSRAQEKFPKEGILFWLSQSLLFSFQAFVNPTTFDSALTFSMLITGFMVGIIVYFMITGIKSMKIEGWIAGAVIGYLISSNLIFLFWFLCNNIIVGPNESYSKFSFIAFFGLLIWIVGIPLMTVIGAILGYLISHNNIKKKNA